MTGSKRFPISFENETLTKKRDSGLSSEKITSPPLDCTKMLLKPSKSYLHSDKTKHLRAQTASKKKASKHSLFSVPSKIGSEFSPSLGKKRLSI